MRNLKLALLLIFTSCIGTDIIGDELKEPEIIFEESDYSVLEGESIELSARYNNEFGIEEDVEFTYRFSTPGLLTISDNTLTGIKSGQTEIIAFYEEVESLPVLITVFSSNEDVASVRIVTNISEVLVGSSIQLEIEAKNGAGDLLVPGAINYFSTDESVVVVDEDGLLTALNEGQADIYAEIEGIRSPSISVNVVSTLDLIASFHGANGYDASGMVSIAMQDGSYKMELPEDFMADFALGTFIYLSNSTAGNVTRSEGVEIAEVTQNGYHLFDLDNIDPELNPGDYRYVIVLCKPASITFGIADFQNP